MQKCECGCGETATRRFVAGHQNRRKGSGYVVIDRGYSTACWLWTGSIAPSTGYSSMRSKGRTRSGHTVFYEERFGPVPHGMQLDHLCRQRSCVNPEHLEPVSNMTNARRGARTKLTLQQVRAIRADGRQDKEIAADYGTTSNYICNIRLGLTWPDDGFEPVRRRRPNRAKPGPTLERAGQIQDGPIRA